MHTKWGGKGSPDPFYIKSKLSISLDQHSELLWSLFLLHDQVEVYQNILELRCWPLAFNFYKAFIKTKRGWKLVSLSHLKKFKFLRLCFINWLNFMAWLSLLIEIAANMCIIIICYPLCDTINFEINLSFLIKLSSYMKKKNLRIEKSFNMN